MTLLRGCGSRYIRTLPSFFWATTILDTHWVGSVTGAIICFSAIASSSVLTVFRSETGNQQGELITGTESGCIWIVYSPGSSPSPVNTSLNRWRTGSLRGWGLRVSEMTEWTLSQSRICTNFIPTEEALPNMGITADSFTKKHNRCVWPLCSTWSIVFPALVLLCMVSWALEACIFVPCLSPVALT